MDATQKKIVTKALRLAFTTSRVCTLSDEQIEMLFGAMVLIAAFGPPEIIDEK